MFLKNLLRITPIEDVITFKTEITDRHAIPKLIKNKKFKRIFYTLNKYFNYILNSENGREYVNILNDKLLEENKLNVKFNYSSNLTLENNDFCIYFVDISYRDEPEKWIFKIFIKTENGNIYLNWKNDEKLILSLLNIPLITNSLFDVYNQMIEDKTFFYNKKKEEILKKYNICLENTNI